MDNLDYRLPQRRRLTTGPTQPGPKGKELQARLEASVPRSVTPLWPRYIAEADGGVLVDVDGNSLIDLGSGIAVTTVGAANPAVVDAVGQAVAKFTHTCFMVSPYESYIEVAERLGELTPGDFEKRTALFNSGAEAVENAVKIARSYTGRNGVAVLDCAYHGRTNLTMAMTAKNMPYKSGFGPFASEVYRVPTSYPLRDGLSGPAAAKRTISVLEQQIGAGNLACLVVEPVQGEGGFVVPAPGYLRELARWCRERGVVFVADEIQSGLCRTGAWFACEQEGVEPDLVTIAKGVAGGLPLSAVTGRAEIMDAPHPGGLGGTYGGNPVACAAALAALTEMERLHLSSRAREIEAIVREVLGPLVSVAGAGERGQEGRREGRGGVAELRGRGGMMALEFADANSAPSAELTSAVARRCRDAGVLVLTCGMDGNVVRLLPPLVIGEELLREGLGVLADAIRAEVSAG
ncbi:4-aminobutyrate--2-oxoglutarate transaminase [Corynebacterium heidelbergense]|uniref:(S)-3-amino-2-methylpropionate transaminase n=1 Tax=Corynebacterium heidelbergense TaxID=2055947 RepID=A0A364VAX3_9CORY|nr:4-aminobutyrate--2-oxoglutarate transaminase [Corynebacterium heidelbergense]RAV33802.1 4-aminobutyrate--2-oxoglutarate transaminase [Corynebacterium heidelbergense]WCZ36794.1 4-aminobutyrate aminotransferase GabT [Corynebacterium heidelbergense]